MPQRTITHEAVMVFSFALASLGLSIIQVVWIVDQTFARVAFCILGIVVFVPFLRMNWLIQKKQIIVCNHIVTYEDMRRSRVPSVAATSTSFAAFSGGVFYNFDAFVRFPVRATLVFAAFCAILWLVSWGSWLLAARLHEPKALRRLRESMENGDEQSNLD